MQQTLRDYIHAAKYARFRPDLGRRETWEESVDRGRQMHLRKYPQAREEILWAYERMDRQEALGSQRALQYAGKPIEDRNQRIYNCCYSYCDRVRFFQEAFYLLLSGCGTGFSVQTHHVAKLPPVVDGIPDGIHLHRVGDSIEGWADALGVLVESFLDPSAPHYGHRVAFDDSAVRPKGSPISSGGKAPGPEPLMHSLRLIETVFLKARGRQLRPIEAYDVVMHASDAVLAGGVRRSASIALFSPDDAEMAAAKTGNWFAENPQRGRSNNSALLVRGKTTREQFRELIRHTREFGEPGFVWSESTEHGVNPCVEASFYPVTDDGVVGWQFCNLSTVNGKAVRSKEHFLELVRAAAILGTLQAGYTSFPYLGEASERITRREALLGVSITGTQENPGILLDPEVQRAGAAEAVRANEKLAAKLGINPAARVTCQKPEGCRPLGEHVVTDRGILTLHELLEGHPHDEPWAEKDGYRAAGFGKISKTYRNGVSKVYRVTLRNGRVLRATPNHPWSVSGRFVQTQDLRVGDAIDSSLGEYRSSSECPLLPPDDDSRAQVVPTTAPAAMSPKLAYLCGMIFGNGSFSKNKKRVRFVHGRLEIAQRYASLFAELFGKCINIHTDKIGRNYVDTGSIVLYDWFFRNGLDKPQSRDIRQVPEAIRRSSRESVLAFIAGYADTDGCFFGGSFCIDSASESAIRSLQVVGEAVGISFSVSHSTAGKNFQKSKSMWKAYAHRKYSQWESLEAINGWSFKSLESPIVPPLRGNGYPYSVASVAMEEEPVETADVEVEGDHQFYDGGLLSHNTTSALLGCSSGIHPSHARRYFRRVQANAGEAPMRFFESANPLAVEPNVWSRDGTGKVLTFCVESLPGATLREHVGAVEFLGMVRSTQENWVKPGTVESRCTQPGLVHSVSNTVTVKPDEWVAVEDYIYDHREDFAGVSLLADSGDLDYPQAAFTEVHTREELLQEYGRRNVFLAEEEVRDNSEDGGPMALWMRLHALESERPDRKRECRLKKKICQILHWENLQNDFSPVDFTQMREEEDGTRHSGEAACAGGRCDIVS